MKVKLLLVALSAALTTSFAAVAADALAKDATTVLAEQAAKAEPAKMRVKPHSHVQAKGGPAPAEVVEARAQPRRPPHDHLRDHKHM